MLFLMLMKEQLTNNGLDPSALICTFSIWLNDHWRHWHCGILSLCLMVTQFTALWGIALTFGLQHVELSCEQNSHFSETALYQLNLIINLVVAYGMPLKRLRVSFYKPRFGGNRSYRLEQASAWTLHTHSIKARFCNPMTHSIKAKML